MTDASCGRTCRRLGSRWRGCAERRCRGARASRSRSWTSSWRTAVGGGCCSRTSRPRRWRRRRRPRSRHRARSAARADRLPRRRRPAGGRRATPAGRVADPARQRFWLLLELVDGEPLAEVAAGPAWAAAARWLADLHVRAVDAPPWTCCATTRPGFAGGSRGRERSPRAARWIASPAVTSAWCAAARLAARLRARRVLRVQRARRTGTPPRVRASTGRWRASDRGCSTWPHSPRGRGARRSGSVSRWPTTSPGRRRGPRIRRSAARDARHVPVRDRGAVARLVVDLDTARRARPGLAGRGAAAAEGMGLRAARRLIVNADDFGRSRAINRGVLRAHPRGS